MKIKNLFAIAALLMGSMSVSAQTVADIGIWKVSYNTVNDGAIIGFKNDVTAAQVKDLEVPATLTDSENGVSNIKIITFGSGLTAISDKVLDKIETIDFSKATNLTTIEADVLSGATALKTVSFGANLATINAGAFENTIIEELDLSGTKVANLEKLFQDNNATLKVVKLSKKLAKIKTNALAKCAILNSVTISNDEVVPLTIEATAFDQTPSLTTLTLPGRTTSLDDNALKGSSIATLTIDKGTSGAINGSTAVTINAIAAPKLTTFTIVGNFNGAIKDGAFDDAPLTTATFGGTVVAGAIQSGAFAGAAKLATVNFNGKLATGAVAQGAFGDGVDYAGSGLVPAGGLVEPVLTINYNVKGITALGFDKKAFSDDGAELNYAKMLTTSEYIELLIADGYTSTATSDYFSLLVTKNAKLAVYTGGSSKYYYAKLYDAANDWKIAKKQGDATVIVYGAYVDQSDAAIYVENLHIIRGYYWVPAGTAVIVKSTSSNAVEMTADDKYNSVLTDATGAKLSNRIKVPAADVIGQTLKENATDTDVDGAGVDNNDYDLYFLAPIEDYGFAWYKFSDSRVLKAGAMVADNDVFTFTGDFYIRANKDPQAARLNVIWLDGSEESETTAIQSVKQNVESDVIYNLAGQKVDANFKGVVIKNGKKMIQK